MSELTPITVAYGDGIGPEIMEATLKILKKAGAAIDIEVIEVGQKLYEKGHETGISDESWAIIKKNKILLKSPITTPQGGGYKSLNVTMRKSLGLYSNVRPCVSYAPYVKTHHPELDVVVVRENEEDLYAGVEYRPTHNMFESLKLISQTGSEKIIRYAFDYAVKYGRKKVTCFVKDNIMKFSDGAFHRIFKEVAQEYPQIENESYIVDIAAARIANRPEDFDVVVTLNLYGDIISDIVAETSGSVGLAGSANIGDEFAMFEAIHGSAPDISGKHIANPSGLINGAIMMLVHIGQAEIATKVHNALLKTIEDGMHTADIFKEELSKKLVNTMEFADEVCLRLGQEPVKMKKVKYENSENVDVCKREITLPNAEKREMVGVDIYINDDLQKPENLAEEIGTMLKNTNFQLNAIMTKGLRIWPKGNAGKVLSDHWCLRFLSKNGEVVGHDQVLNLASLLEQNNVDFVKIENLFNYDGVAGYSMPQG